MKLCKYVGFLLAGVFLLTGCGNVQVLECKIENNSTEGVSISQSADMKFKEEKLQKISIIMDAKIDDTDSIDSLSETVVPPEYENYSGKGLDYSLTKKKDGFTYKLKVNFDEVSDDFKNSFDLINYTHSYNQIKKELEKNGYTCN